MAKRSGPSARVQSAMRDRVEEQKKISPDNATFEVRMIILTDTLLDWCDGKLTFSEEELSTAKFRLTNDGATSTDIAGQLEQLPKDATHLC